MTKSIATLAFTAMFLASCSAPSKFPSIREHPWNHSPISDYLKIKLPPSYDEYALNNRYDTASSFVHAFAKEINMPFAYVTWATEHRRASQWLDDAKPDTFADMLKKISTWAGPYQIKLYPEFVEIAWTDNEQEKKTRESIDKWVPPIVFHSRYAADFLRMWHAVSGMNFKYNPELIKDSLKYDEERLSEEGEGEYLYYAMGSHSYAPGFLQFESVKRSHTDDFMNRLAARVGGQATKTMRDGWIIEKMQRNKQGIEIIEKCINTMKGKNDRSSEFIEAAEILSRIGEPALPEILRELNPHDYNSVKRPGEINYWSVLSRLSSPRRGEILLSLLCNEHQECNEILIEALSALNYRAAIPKIETIYKNRKDISSRLALNALGKPPMSVAEEKSPEASISVQKEFQTEKGQRAMALLKAMLNQCDEFKPGMKIQSVERNNSDILSINGAYLKSRTSWKSTGWSFHLQETRENRATIIFRRDNNEYFGKLEKHDGRWLAIKWKLYSIID